jgi:hypothetical protein
LCPIGWLFPSEGKWVETCWFVSSSLAYIDPVLFCKQLSCRCKPPRAVKKKNWSWVPWDPEPRMIVLVRASSNLPNPTRKLHPGFLLGSLLDPENG